MAIVRMVNGISDKAQKGKTAVSVSHNAAAAGMIVVTPQCSHNPDHRTQSLFLAVAPELHLYAPVTLSARSHHYT